MSLLEQIKRRVIAAMRSGNELEKSILRVALGELQNMHSNAHREIELADEQRVLRKMIAGNLEVGAKVSDPVVAEKLNEENAILESLLPKQLSQAEIEIALSNVVETVQSIRDAKSDGQATGVAMKTLKALNADASGTDVSAVVRRMRGLPATSH